MYGEGEDEFKDEGKEVRGGAGGDVQDGGVGRVNFSENKLFLSNFVG